MSALAIAQSPPPNLGQETKGEPAVEETQVATPDSAATPEGDTQPKPDTQSNNPFGTTTVKESRRDSGQIYMIELEHSSGRKQYIEENDSDGNIESQATDIEDTPNLPKWRLGSW